MKNVMSKYSPSLGMALVDFRYAVTADFRVLSALFAMDNVLALERLVSLRFIFVMNDVSAVDSMLASTFFWAYALQRLYSSQTGIISQIVFCRFFVSFSNDFIWLSVSPSFLALVSRFSMFCLNLSVNKGLCFIVSRCFTVSSSRRVTMVFSPTFSMLR